MLKLAAQSNCDPMCTQGIIVSIVNIMQWLVNFCLSRWFYQKADAMNYGGVFGLYAACSLAGAIFTWLFVPETKNKTLAEIQDKLNNRAARKPHRPHLRKRHHDTEDKPPPTTTPRPSALSAGFL